MKPSWRPLGWIVLAGFVARLVFLFVGSTVVWGGQRFNHPDAWQYVAAATNLVDHGTYTADPTYADALFTRVPGYSLIWALLYVLLGRSAAYFGAAVLQVLLDTASIALLYSVARGAGANRRAALFAAGGYAVYPFAIFWVTPTAPDTLTMFVLLVALVALLHGPPGWRGAVLFGAAAAVATLVREYLGVVVLSAGAYWMVTRTSWREFAALAVAGGTAFAVVFSPWPLRNGLGHGRWIIFRSESSGSRFYERDVRAAVSWVELWALDATPYLDRIEHPPERIDYPPSLFADDAERRRAIGVSERARACGTGVHASMHAALPTHPCDAEVAAGFDALSRSYTSRHPLASRLAIPIEGLVKIVFKSELTTAGGSGAKQLAVRALFVGRTVLFLLGLGGLIAFRREKRLAPVTVFVTTLVLFLAFIVRGVQIRYLLQADCLLFVPAAMLVDATVSRARAAMSTRRQSLIGRTT